MIAYTSIYGAYDSLKAHPEVPGVEWRCYTDDKTIDNPGGWEVVYEPARFPHPRLSAKWRKCHPPTDDGSTLWVDGGVTVIGSSLIADVLVRLVDAPMVMFRHPWRDCIYEEVGASASMVKYAGLPLQEQVHRYAGGGWPAHAGLWASTIIGRRNTDQTTAFGAAWFAHCELLTYQDQLSLPPLLDRYGLTPAPLPFTLCDHPGFHWGGHRSEL